MRQALSSRVQTRLTAAYAPKTTQSYNRMFTMFLLFAEFACIRLNNIQVGEVLMFLEFLAFNGLKFGTICNYLSAIRTKLKWHSLSEIAFEHHKVKVMLTALQKTLHQQPRIKNIFSLNTLEKIVCASFSLPDPWVFITIYLFAFMGFLRISNLVPTSSNCFDVHKQLCLADVIEHKSNIAIVLKWSKTLQCRQQGTFILLPKLGNSILCPFNAFTNMCKDRRFAKFTPLFTIKSKPVSQFQVRAHLHKVLSIIGLDPTLYTFHTFRRSGATLAFNSNVNINSIKRHGTWNSDTEHQYIISDPNKASEVANMFQNIIKT